MLVRARSFFVLSTLLAAIILVLPSPLQASRSVGSHVGIHVPPIHSFVPADWVPDWPLFQGGLLSPAPLAELAWPDTQPISPQSLRTPRRWTMDDPEWKPPVGPTGLSYHPNGHVLVAHPAGDNASSAGARRRPLEPHPIVTLMTRAEEEWKAKVARQSRSLAQAVAEYKRRYGRRPPRGFDKWWQYARDHDVMLVDEYDQIHRDLYPFWALHPEELRRRAEYTRQRPFTYTLLVHPNGSVSTTGEFSELKRARDLATVIEMVKAYSAATWDEVPMTMTRDDQPEIQLGWKQRDLLFHLTSHGEYLNLSRHIIEEDPALTNWAASCPPTSPLRRLTVEDATEFPLDQVVHDAPFSFIWSHRRAMDPCLRPPEVMNLHGFTSGKGTNLGPLLPLFSFSKTDVHSDILVTPLEQYASEYIGDDKPWDEKPFNKVMWRGTTTGAWQGVDNPHWNQSQRIRLHHMTHTTHGSHKLLVSHDPHSIEPVHVVEILNRDFNSKYMDTSLVDGPIQCDEEICKVLAKEIEFSSRFGLDESYKYKYVIDVDGNAWSGRFHRLMWTNRMVMKSTIFPEWYMDRIQPWVHYVPIKLTYDDLYGVTNFFIGGVDGAPGNDKLGRKIAESGRDWARSMWRKEDMASYMFRLVLEWNRVYHRSTDQSDLWDFESVPFVSFKSQTHKIVL